MKRSAFALALVVVGCAVELPENSTDIATADIGLTLRIGGTPTETRISGSVLGPGRTVRLVEGDRLDLETPLGTTPLAPKSGGFGLTLPPVGGDFAVVLTRPEGRGGDKRLVGYLPPPFHVDVPATASRANTLTLTWDTAVGPFVTRISVGGLCVAAVSRTLSFDVGTYTFNRYELASSAAQGGTCTVTVDVIKVWSPSPGAYAENVQTTRATLEMTP